MTKLLNENASGKIFYALTFHDDNKEEITKCNTKTALDDIIKLDAHCSNIGKCTIHLSHIQAVMKMKQYQKFLKHC
jgi:hypothetical protein